MINSLKATERIVLDNRAQLAMESMSSPLGMRNLSFMKRIREEMNTVR
jgi:hypothetical protein